VLIESITERKFTLQTDDSNRRVSLQQRQTHTTQPQTGIDTDYTDTS